MKVMVDGRDIDVTRWLRTWWPEGADSIEARIAREIARAIALRDARDDALADPIGHVIQVLHNYAAQTQCAAANASAEAKAQTPTERAAADVTTKVKERGHASNSTDAAAREQAQREEMRAALQERRVALIGRGVEALEDIGRALWKINENIPR